MWVLSEFSCGQFIQLKPEFATTLFYLERNAVNVGHERFLTGAFEAKKRVTEKKNTAFQQSHIRWHHLFSPYF